MPRKPFAKYTDEEIVSVARHILDGMIDDFQLSPVDCGTVISYLAAYITFSGGKKDDGSAIDLMARSAKMIHRSLLANYKEEDACPPTKPH